MERITPDRPWPLFGTAATRSIEQAALAALPTHTLMRRAGAAVARLAGALAPHARMVWIACGPGNNGGDGLEAAALLHRAGRPVTVTLTGDPARLPADAAAALVRTRQAGVAFADGCPPGLAAQDLCIDALLGLGAGTGRPPLPWLTGALQSLRDAPCPVLAVDLPSGLSADTGQWATGTEPGHPGAHAPSPRYTLALLTLKPGLFTAEGRDAAGSVWLDTLDVDPAGTDGGIPPTAWLAGPPQAGQRPHATHKGRYGDVAVVGGEGLGRRGMGMTGAAVLAATAALHAGAGRVLLALLDGNAGVTIDAAQPELMLRSLAALDMEKATVVCGCGGGDAVREALPRVLGRAARLVLDADALNAIASDESLQRQLEHRGRRSTSSGDGTATVLTPHPLEAGRLLGRSAAEVQADRLDAARALARRFGCVAVVKGSGTVIAAPDGRVSLNPTGNGRLATAGTGDVLAGMVGARLAAGLEAFAAASAAVYAHGALADHWPAGQPLTAGLLARLTPGQKKPP